MNKLRDQWREGRGKMIRAMAELTTLALRAGADHDRIREIQAEFFDGNVESKDAFEVIAFRAEIRMLQRPPS